MSAAQPKSSNAAKSHVGSHAPSLSAALVHDLEMGVGEETACDMQQSVRAALREDILGDPTAKCLAEISDLMGSKLARNQNRVLDRRMTPLQIAEPAPQMLPRETPSADEYRAMAGLCINWARQPLTKDAHRFCVTLARVWLRAAISQDAAISDSSRKSPLVFDDRKVLIEDCLATEDRITSVGYSFGRPDASNKLFESGGASEPERAHSLPKLALRDYLRVAILALTVGATSGAGAVL